MSHVSPQKVPRAATGPPTRKIPESAHRWLHFHFTFALKTAALTLPPARLRPVPAARTRAPAPPARQRPRTLHLVQVQRQLRLRRVLLLQTFQQLLVFPNELGRLLTLGAELFLKSSMDLTCFLQLSKHI